jgi:mono/diheme cytochrome c family protein
MKTRLAGVVVAALAVFSVAGLAFAAGGGSGDGEALFKQNCAGCHTLGGGDTVAPDLKGVVARAGEERVRAFIATPEKVLASGDPEVAALLKRFNNVKMPNLGLTPEKVDALVAYLKGGSAAKPAAPKPKPAAAGDAAAGKRLFNGQTHLANGGPACNSCHTIAGAGALGGGSVGPDLTKAYSKYGGAKGVPSVLASLPFPTMQPVYADHALTTGEQADLAAFLAASDGKTSPGDSTWPLVLLGVGVVALAVLVALVVWPRRRLVVRRTIAPTSTLTRR